MRSVQFVFAFKKKHITGFFFFFLNLCHLWSIRLFSQDILAFWLWENSGWVNLEEPRVSKIPANTGTPWGFSAPQAEVNLTSSSPSLLWGRLLKLPCLRGSPILMKLISRNSSCPCSIRNWPEHAPSTVGNNSIVFKISQSDFRSIFETKSTIFHWSDFWWVFKTSWTCFLSKIIIPISLYLLRNKCDSLYELPSILLNTGMVLNKLKVFIILLIFSATRQLSVFLETMRSETVACYWFEWQQESQRDLLVIFSYQLQGAMDIKLYSKLYLFKFNKFDRYLYSGDEMAISVKVQNIGTIPKEFHLPLCSLSLPLPPGPGKHSSVLFTTN